MDEVGDTWDAEAIPSCLESCHFNINHLIFLWDKIAAPLLHGVDVFILSLSN